MAGRPRAFKDEAKLRADIEEYLETAERAEVPITMAGLAVHLGCCRDTLVAYERGEYDDSAAQYSVAIKRAKTVIEADKLEKALLGKYNPAVAIFDLKNNHGYKDAKQLEHSGPDGDPLPVSQINADLDVARRIAWILDAPRRKLLAEGKTPLTIDQQEDANED
jgi:DNA-binding XRE family transcriptional regulator